MNKILELREKRAKAWETSQFQVLCKLKKPDAK